MDRRDTLRLEKELLDRSMENCREDIKLVYPVFLASGGYVFAHLEEVLNFDFSLKTWLGLAEEGKKMGLLFIIGCCIFMGIITYDAFKD